MNLIYAFNRTMDYIETVLDDKIDERKVSQLSGYSYAMFSRIFSILTDTTLMEYIRLRRLTKSAADLRTTQMKVIDIAMTYGYDSPDSFGAAFKAYHGFTPSEVRRGKPYRVFPPIQLTLSVKGGRTMEISIQRKPAFAVAGIRKEGIDTSQCPAVWQQLFERAPVHQLEQMGSGQSFGVCYAVKDVRHLNYMAAYETKDLKAAASMNLEVLHIPENEYAVVQLAGPVPQCIHDGWKYLMEIFLTENGFCHSGAPDFEVYQEGDMYAPDYRMELWVPVVKASE